MAIMAEKESAALLGIPAMPFEMAEGAIDFVSDCALIWGRSCVCGDRAFDRVMEKAHSLSLKVRGLRPRYCRVNPQPFSCCPNIKDPAKMYEKAGVL